MKMVRYSAEAARAHAVQRTPRRCSASALRAALARKDDELLAHLSGPMLLFGARDRGSVQYLLTPRMFIGFDTAAESRNRRSIAVSHRPRVTALHVG
jgi:hypothetical protein